MLLMLILAFWQSSVCGFVAAHYLVLGTFDEIWCSFRHRRFSLAVPRLLFCFFLLNPFASIDLLCWG